MWQYSRLLSISSCHWMTCGSFAFKYSFPSYEQEVSLTSTRLSALREGLWHLVEEESLFRDSFGVLLLQPSIALHTLRR